MERAPGLCLYNNTACMSFAGKRPLCEVRVPTFRRPAMLRRALASLRAQIEPRWTAIVMDDSPDCEAARVAEEFADPRILYQANKGRGGAAINIDRAFRTSSYTGTPYAFALEDDNALDPDFVADNIARLETSRCEILLRNQRIGVEAPDMEYRPTDLTTRGSVLEDGHVDVLTLRAALFFCEGISNGGLFWRTDARSDLQVGPAVKSAALQEHVRTLKIDTPIVFAADPLATFSLPPGGETTREPLENRMYNRARQAILRRLLRQHGSTLVEAAQRLARTDEMQRRLTKELADILHFPDAVSDLRQGAKGLAKIALIRDPLAQYWRAMRNLEGAS